MCPLEMEYLMLQFLWNRYITFQKRKRFLYIWNVRTNAFYSKLGYIEARRDNEFIYYSKKHE